MSDAASPLKTMPDRLAGVFRRALEARRPALDSEEVGHVESVGEGVVHVLGLSRAAHGEIIRFSGGGLGMAAELDEERVGVILLSDEKAIAVGSEARPTDSRARVPVGPELLGRVIDPLGNPLDGRGPVPVRMHLPIERPAPPIIHRAPVSQPLQTGIKVVDATIPIGRGQRELILGDRQTGKTAIALSAIINQRNGSLNGSSGRPGNGGVISIYCAIGQRGSAVRRAVAELERHDALADTVVVAASGEDPSGLQFIAPYAATSIGEYFMAQGRDVLIVYDDLTRHARAYRELSLLLRRPPGREAYPGDVFFAHARLLERATRLKREYGGGSLTALPIVETQAENIAAYIPTNLISITDGQIYLSPTLFSRGQLPAIDVGRSVSRVGGKAQLPAYRAVAGPLRLAYAQFEELEIFSRFGARLDKDTLAQLERGRRVRAVLRQREHERLSAPEQIAVLLAASEGVFDAVPLDAMRKAEAAVISAASSEEAAILDRIAQGEKLDAAMKTALLDCAARALTRAELG